jgi:trimethylamine--corrinoid protein Co-methyltransferase
MRRDQRKTGRRRADGHQGGAPAQAAWRQPRNPYRPQEVFSADQIEAIHAASLVVLQEIGINFLLPEACELWRRAGAAVEGDGPRVRFEAGLIENLIGSLPERFTLHARNAERHLELGGDAVAFAVVSSAPNVSDLERGRRPGNFADFCDLLRLAQALDVCHLIGGYPVEPIDLDPATRHLDAVAAMLCLSDKVVQGYALGRQRMADAIEMVRIARGLSDYELEQQPSLYTVVNANSPLQYDGPMLEGMMEMARHNQPVLVTPFTLAGAMAPVTLPGALVQQNAEALAGLAFTQVVRPGAPAVYGSFTSNVDMKSGAPAFGTPEYAMATIASGQLARRYKVPLRTSNATAANAPDAQAAYESQMSIWSSLLAGSHMLKHGLGWLEGGLCASFEKMVIDAEMLQMMSAFLEPPQIDSASLALEAMREVGPGGHYFGAAHTLERYDNAFYQPLLSDWRNFESWSKDGARDATQRAHDIWQALLAEYNEPAMDPAVAEELEAFVARRKAEGGATA